MVRKKPRATLVAVADPAAITRPTDFRATTALADAAETPLPVERRIEVAEAEVAAIERGIDLTTAVAVALVSASARAIALRVVTDPVEAAATTFPAWRARVVVVAEVAAIVLRNAF
jgi:hypothetical protein